MTNDVTDLVAVDEIIIIDAFKYMVQRSSKWPLYRTVCAMKI
jgi:hypothetical protein